MIRVGTAGWTIPREARFWCAGTGSHLQRYATHFSCVEINSSFYRSHRRDTYARWASSVPSGFKFAVKCPREITHERQLLRIDAPLKRFLDEIGGLGRARGPVLIQFAPSFEFRRTRVARFLERYRSLDRGPVVCEPRHPSWFTGEADSLLSHFHVGRVAADPIRCAGAGLPGGWPALAYFRLHGSPRTYWTRYHIDFVATLAHMLRAFPSRAQVWCIFDNTATGAAIENARELLAALGP